MEIHEGQQTVTTVSNEDADQVFREAREGRFVIYQMSLGKNNAGWVFSLGWNRKQGLPEPFFGF